jgi:ribosomal protein S27E
MAIKYHYSCPQDVCRGCGGEKVLWTFTNKQVKVAACSSLLAQGWVGVQAVYWPEQAEEILSQSRPAGYMHKDGLVLIR